MDTPIPPNPAARFVGSVRSPGVIRARWWVERGIVGFLFASAALTILVTFAIVGVLLVESRKFFLLPGASVTEFFTSGRWSPLLGGDKHFGVWPLICGTGLVTVVAAAIALPLGLMTAVYLSEYAPRRARAVLKPILEVLAGIPTVVYGYFALTFITPLMQKVQGFVNGFSETFAFLPSSVHGVVFRELDSYNALSAGLAIGGDDAADRVQCVGGCAAGGAAEPA